MKLSITPIALLFFGACSAYADWRDHNLVVNPGAEDVEGGKPVGWGCYKGKGEADWGVSADAHTGKRSAFLRTLDYGEWRNGLYINAGLVVGDSNAYEGKNAYQAEPNTLYYYSFWIRGTIPNARIDVVGWPKHRMGPDDRIPIPTTSGRIPVGAQWRRAEGYFQTTSTIARFVLRFHVYGFNGEVPLGEVFVDDVTIAKGPELQPIKRNNRFSLAENVMPLVNGRPIEEIVDRYHDGDEATRKWIERKVEQARSWAEKDDSWFLERAGKHTPLGMWTLACPFHPEQIRDFSNMSFEWSIEDPWRLVCPLCKAEGRALFYYPNERYPDDGSGCRPTDKVWSEDHDAAWSRRHGNIPYEHWDGSPHGYSASGYAYFFLGKCSHLIMTSMAKRTLPSLAQGYVLLNRLFPEDAQKQALSSLCARKTRLALLTLARAHLGDLYLADVLGISPDEFRERMRTFFRDDPKGLATEAFPGYTPYDLFDGLQGDTEHPGKSRADVFGNGSYHGDLYAKQWTVAYLLVRDSFPEDEKQAGIHGMVERLFVADENDAERLRDKEDGVRSVKKGILDCMKLSRAMTVGSSNNLGGRELTAKFLFGRLLGDEQLVDCVVRNAWFYLRNYFTGDGLGREGSPAYTNCAWNTMRSVYQNIYTYRGRYGPEHPWWDDQIGGLNPYRDPVMKEDVVKEALSLFPDGKLIPWMDSHVEARPNKAYLNHIANEGAGLPKEYERYFDVEPTGRGRVLASVKPELTLPSLLLQQSRKAVFRTGRRPQQTVLSIDYAPNTGHWHPAPMDLVLYALGHELASDLGYMGAMSRLTKRWIRTCPAHNTCIIRNADGGHGFTHNLQGDIHEVYVAAGPVNVVEVAELDAGDLSNVPGKVPALYQRTTFLISVDPDHPYVLDVFRVRGGAVHDFYFHGQGRSCEARGIQRDPLKNHNVSLYDVSGFSCKQPADFGCGAIRSLKEGQTDTDFEVRWTEIPKWTDGPEPKVDGELGLRLLMPGRRGTQVFLGQAPGQRRTNNWDLGENLHVLCVRRKADESIDTFISVIEPYRSKPLVKRVQSIPVDTGVCVRVDLPQRVDTILVNAPQGMPCTTVKAGEFVTDARAAFVSEQDGRVECALLAGGRRLTAGMATFEIDPPVEAMLKTFDEQRSVLVAESKNRIPVGRGLHDRTLIVKHKRGASAFTIDSIRELSDGIYEISLRWGPHLMENLFQVTQSAGVMLGIEPPPSLPARSRDGTLKYHAYLVGDERPPKLLGGVISWTNDSMMLDMPAMNVKAGSIIGVTRLKCGTDKITIPSWLLFTRRDTRVGAADEMERQL